MGNGVSGYNRFIYVEIHGRTEKILFSRHSSSRDIQEVIALAAGASSWTGVMLKDKNGGLIAITPNIMTNTTDTPYKVQVVDQRARQGITDNSEMLHTVISQVAEQFNRVFKTEEVKEEISKRINALEKREGLKVVEIERCRKDIHDLRNQLLDNKNHHHAHHDHLHRSSTSGSLSDDRKIGFIQDMPTYPKYILSRETIDYLKKPTFDIWHWEPNEMLSLLEHMYHELGLVHEFNMNPITLKRWLLMVQSNYRNNPFHNFRHCFCVTQMMYGMIHLCRLQNKMSRFDLGLLITACVCHDLDHPGYNNAYQINARTELAIRYNDQSPLENHHAAVCFQILSQPECNIFSNVSEEMFIKIRVGIISLILATDMARHAEILDKFKQNIDHFDWTNEDHITSLKMILIKCCDISNEVRPMDVSDPWLDLLLEEYFNQSDREKAEGLPVAPFMDREKVTKPTAQIGFIKFVLIPLFDSVAKLFPQADAALCESLRQAQHRYEKMKVEEDTRKALLQERKASTTGA
ncbi:high affinity cGMP-specific 3',5'-cyclic phosphodiesterase 9A-like isoform X2 [Paramacrobiotus metropolitanus]|uniref:high affinity cGMP-specific 3',5'-cyclic phosphodiesterase 9A-like isoform X2 n=1 Tax=Paramacrobiotus metropolitanus TaxID=2943436 RepID=UPI002445CF0B|nr:high affinity cGMP-specific 3',5'-cyclic phosphodiesterase 9A-like isoform X2 [Paramacrobiotus metropolitanus]